MRDIRRRRLESEFPEGGRILELTDTLGPFQPALPSAAVVLVDDDVESEGVSESQVSSLPGAALGYEFRHRYEHLVRGRVAVSRSAAGREGRRASVGRRPSVHNDAAGGEGYSVLVIAVRIIRSDRPVVIGVQGDLDAVAHPDVFTAVRIMMRVIRHPRR